MIDPVLVPAIISLSFSGIIGIISQIQHSRCSSIKCWGCECVRQVPKEEQEENSQLQNEVQARIVDLPTN
jgi:hypothetical protein